MSTNGWGKGSVNNSNGWGAGAVNNDIGWGDSHFKSWSGDTDIDGGTGIPVNTVAPVISGTTTLGSVLTCTTGTWTAKPTSTYTYQWKRNGLDIAGATNSTYTLVNEDGATNIFCKVTATNEFGSANANSNTLAIPAFTDADAQAFITAASITDPTQQSAINQLVTDLKGYGIWTKMKALYPFVGGTASSHKFNLKDPRDLDAAFRLVFNGGWTHSSTGALPNGINGYADTKYKEIVSDANNFHISTYLRTNTSGAFADMGVVESSYGETDIISLLNSKFYARVHGAELNGIANTDSRGLFIANRIINTQVKAIKNSNITNINNTSVHISQNYNIYIGAFNTSGTANAFSPRQTSFASIGNGLTDTEAANFYTAVQAFQTTLNRQV